MLIGIPPVIGPELLAILHRMGHGDEIVLADAFFPGDTFNSRVIRADGVRVAPLIEGVLTLFNLDDYDPHPIIMMAAVPGDTLDDNLERSYRAAIEKCWPKAVATHRLERFAFYERAKKAFAIVLSGETSKYGNIILKKGVVPVNR